MPLGFISSIFGGGSDTEVEAENTVTVEVTSAPQISIDTAGVGEEISEAISMLTRTAAFTAITITILLSLRRRR